MSLSDFDAAVRRKPRGAGGGRRGGRLRRLLFGPLGLSILAAVLVFALGIGLGIFLGSQAGAPSLSAGEAQKPPSARQASKQTRATLPPAQPGAAPLQTPDLPTAAAIRPGTDPDRAPNAPAAVARTAPLAVVAATTPGTAVPAWRANALPVSLPPGRPMIAILIDDMGLDRRRSDRAVDLKAPVTLSYLTYARDLAVQTAAARAAGHELMLHMPMEPEGTADPGPEALQTWLQPAELQRRIDWGLARFDGYIGVNNHMGSRFTANATAMRPVLAALAARGLLFVDSMTSPASVGREVAAETGTPALARDVFLDNVETVAEVRHRLGETERVAAANGTAIAIGHPHDATLAALEPWLAEVEARGFVLAPVSQVAMWRFEHQPTWHAQAVKR